MKVKVSGKILDEKFKIDKKVIFLNYVGKRFPMATDVFISL